MRCIRIIFTFILILGIQACDSLGENSSPTGDIAFQDQNSLRLGAPDILISSRAVAVDTLQVEVRVNYTAGGEDYETVDQVSALVDGGDPYWQLGINVPANTPFSLTMIWYEQNPRLNLIRITREFEGLGSSSTVSFAHDFSSTADYSNEEGAENYAGYDDDGDRTTNLEERLAQTEPFQVIGDPDLLQATPANLNLRASGSAAQSATVELNDVDGLQRSFTASSDSAWLRLTPVSGQIQTDTPFGLTVSYNCNNEPDVLNGNIEVRSSGFTTSIPVQLTCARDAAPLLSIEPIDFVLTQTTTNTDNGTLTFGNTGNAVLNYTVSSSVDWIALAQTSGQVQPGAVQEIAFDAACGTTVERRSGALNINSDGGDASVAVVLDCTPQPIRLAVQPLSVSLNAQNATLANTTFVVENTGSEPLGFSIFADAGWLELTPSSGSVPAGGSTEIQVSALCPAETTTRQGVISVNSDSGNASVSVAQNCFAPSTPILSDVMSALSLTAPSGDSATSSIRLSNEGDALLTYELISNDGWIATTPSSGTIGVGGSATVTVQALCEGSIGNRSSTLNVKSDGGDDSVAVDLLCEGATLGPVSPSSLNLTAFTRQSIQDVLRFSNTGNIELGYTLNSDVDWLTFADSSGQVPPGDSQRVIFDATCGPAVELRTGTLNIITGVGNATVDVQLDCTRRPDALVVLPLSLNLDAQTGGEGVASIEVQNTDNVALNFTIDSGDEWLQATPLRGEIPANSRTGVSLSAVCPEQAVTRQTRLQVNSDSGTAAVTITQNCTELPRAILADVVPELSLTSPTLDSTTSSLDLSNIGTAVLEYRLVSDSEWLAASPISGSVNPGSSMTLDIDASCGAEVEILSAKLEITSNGGDDIVEVSLRCTGAILSDIKPESFELSASYLQAAQSDVSFTNTGNAILMFSVQSDSSWLCPDNLSSGECSTDEFSGQLSPGDSYRLPIVATCEDGISVTSGSLSFTGNFDSVDVPVSLTCSPPPLQAAELFFSDGDPKVFSFSWTDQPSADFYQILQSPDGEPDYIAISPKIPMDVEFYQYTVALHLHAKSSYILQTCSSSECVDSDAISRADSVLDSIGVINGPAESGFGGSIDISGDGKTLAVLHVASQMVSVYRQSVTEYGSVDWLLEEQVDLAKNSDVSISSTSTVSLSDDGGRLAIGMPDAFYFNCECSSGAVALLSKASAPQVALVVSEVPVAREAADGNWAIDSVLHNPELTQGGGFGHSLALDKTGNRLMVGSKVNEVYEYMVGGRDEFGIEFWTRTNVLIPPTRVRRSTSGFGQFLQVSANMETIAISAQITTGANLESDVDVVETVEVVFVYESDGDGAFSYVSMLMSSATNNDGGGVSGCDVAAVEDCGQPVLDSFGFALSVSGNGEYIAVGALRESGGDSGINGDENDNSLNSSGAAYVFERAGGEWNQQAYIKASYPAENDVFGYSIDMDFTGNVLAVGAPLEASRALGIGGDETNDDTELSPGAGYVFSQENGQWQQVSYIKASESSQLFGTVVRLSGDGKQLFISSVANNEVYYY